MFRSLFSSNKEDPSRSVDVLHVQHGNTVHNLTFGKGAITDARISVKDLKLACGKATGVTGVNSMKLLHSGKNLKDDDKPLSSYSIRSGSKIVCMASKSKLEAPNKAGVKISGTPSPILLNPNQKIDVTRKFVETTLLPLIASFENAPPGDAAKKADEHRRLTETVMGELIKLDSIDVDEQEGSRKRRKDTIRELQSLLERLDVAMKGTPKN